MASPYGLVVDKMISFFNFSPSGDISFLEWKIILDILLTTLTVIS